MRLPQLVRKSAVGALRSGPVVSTSIAVTSGRPRVLAYHRVPTARGLDRHLAMLGDRFRFVSAAEMVGSLRHGSPLPRRPLWITFDDGDPSVVESGLPALARHGVTATLFVCPGLIESREPFWWDVVARAPLDSLRELIDPTLTSGHDAVERCKSIPDADRRRIVSLLPEPPGTAPRQLTTAQIDRWLDAGHTLGNHTWDHPCLDQCNPETQREQVNRADAWLRQRAPGWEPLFAYPNGNISRPAHHELVHLDYALALLHDHRLTDANGDPMAVSRLHVDVDDSAERVAGIVGGLQPALRHAGRVAQAPVADRIKALGRP